MSTQAPSPRQQLAMAAWTHGSATPGVAGLHVSDVQTLASLQVRGRQVPFWQVLQRPEHSVPLTSVPC